MSSYQIDQLWKPGQVDILGMKVHDVTYEEALTVIGGCIRSRRVAMVVTPNTEFAMRARRDKAFRALVNEATLAIPDGIGLVWAARLLGGRLREHVRGTDLVEKLASIGAKEGYRFFLLGAGAGVAEKASAKLRHRYPGLQIVGTHSGSSCQSYDQQAITAIADAGEIDILLVAYGAPAQEYWIARNQHKLGIPVAIGVGGVLDFFSGEARRAPRWVRRIELEWLYRLIRQPWRWRRQLALPRFVIVVLITWLKRKT